MKILFTSYVSVPEYDEPADWLKRIRGFTGILESLVCYHEVVAIERINYEGHLLHKGVSYHFTRLSKKVERFPWRMHALIRKLGPDIVFVNGFIFPLQIIQLKMTVGPGTRIIVLNQAEQPFRGLRKYLQRAADHFVDMYFFPSAEFGMQWVGRGNIGRLEKIKEVLHGSSVFQYQGDEELVWRRRNGIGPVFLWVGRLDENKDPVTVLKAFGRYCVARPGASLYMIYHTEELIEELRELICGNKLISQSVFMIGKVSHEAMQSWYDRADFIISGSHYEGGGIAVCEGMSCGCIPIVTDIISFRKMTGPGRCGLLYEAGNEQALYELLMQTGAMDIKAEREKVIKQFREELSFEAIAGKINRLIMQERRVD